MAELIKLDRQAVEDALRWIPADIGHDDRVRVAFAVFDAIGNDGGDSWKQWAAGRKDSNSAKDAAIWRSVHAGGTGRKVTSGTLVYMAMRNGWKPHQSQRKKEQSAAELAADRAKREQEEAAEAQALQRDHETAAGLSRAAWDAARTTPPPEVGCPYLTHKRIGGHGLRYLRDGTALVPMRDIGGALWSVQRLLPADLIDKETGEVIGNKLYGPRQAKDAAKVRIRKMGLFHLIGSLNGAGNAPAIVLVEGYATGATIHEVTGQTVAVCFDSGNLRHIARALRERFPAARLLICGDDDHETEARGKGNPGRKAAAAAAKACGGPVRLCFPRPLHPGISDFNDLANSAGPAAVNIILQLHARFLAA